MRQGLRSATRLVHGPGDPDEYAYSPVSRPIYQTTAFRARSAKEWRAVLDGKAPGFAYSRVGNPTSRAFASAVADLEGAEGEDAAAFSSGMAAILGTLAALRVSSGDRVVASRGIYGNTSALFSGELARWGVVTRTVDASDPSAVARALSARTRVLYVEAISNPLLRVADLPTLAALARRSRAHLVVDATFATPLLCRPLAAGASAVVHSATKFLSGHGDVTAGVAVAPGMGRALARSVMNLGGALSPHDAWLCLRGMQTLELRLARQCSNAAALGNFLRAHAKVARVHYPGHPSHPDHATALRALSGAFGAADGTRALCALASFELAGGRRAALRFLDALRLVARATTLGDVQTLVLHPASTSHRQLSATALRAAGIAQGLVRLSAGIESADDLVADLDQALRKA